MKSVLMIAYHYPPEGSSSGVQRTLRFTHYLLERGWRGVVLTVNPRVYTVARTEQLEEIPSSVPVVRAFALDSARHLSYGGRYLGFTALPDRWVTWWPGGVASGLSLIRKWRPRALWSTYPIASAHLIAMTLARLSGLPWVADFRDSMTEDDYPLDERQRRVYRWIERRVLTRASRVVFVTPSAVRMHAARYPEVPESRFALIPNGYDEGDFRQVEALDPIDLGRDHPEQIVLLHSGSLYPSERDPRCFYGAVRRLMAEGAITPLSLRIVLRATGHDDHHAQLLDRYEIAPIVSLKPSLPYRRALREMMDVDGLLIFQGSSCNHQIPAKIYEYLRAQRPILAFTDPRGDTAEVLRQAGIRSMAPLDDEEAVKSALLDFLKRVRGRRVALPKEAFVKEQSRQAGAAALASVLDSLTNLDSAQ